jgi:hypothetical protein
MQNIMEGKESYVAETKRECAWEAERMRKREVVLVQRSTDLHEHEKEMQSGKQDKLCR